MTEMTAPTFGSQGGFPRPASVLIDVLLLAALFAGLLYGIGSYGLYEPHEGHFAGVARGMYFENDWVTPRLNGSPYLNKPPLFYWMITVSYALFGVSEWAARFPQILIGWLGVLLAWKWARELWGPRAGRVAAVVLGVSAGWYLFAHQLLIDEMLSTLHLLGLYAFWKCTQNPQRIRNWAAFYVVIAISILAKGLVGAAFLLVLWLAFSFWRKAWPLWRISKPWLGLLIVVALVGPWLVLIEMRNPGFLNYVIFNEHIDRIFNRRWPPDFEVSKTSALGYLLIALVWLAPWSLFLPQIASFSANASKPDSGEDSGQRDAVLILIIGAMLPTVLFLPVPSRLIYYCLPSLPPFAVLAAGWWVHMDQPMYARGRVAAGVSALLAGAMVGVAGFTVGERLRSFPELAAAPRTLDFIPIFAAFIGAGLVSCGAFILARRSFSALLLSGAILLIGEAYNTAGFAAFDPMRSSKRMVAELLPKTKSNWIWISEGSLEIGAAGGTAFYLGLDSAGKPRSVLVMKDDPRRRPPRFPGAPPVYLIDRAELQKIWSGTKPALYFTDFLRTNWEADPPNLPPEPLHEIRLSAPGQRRVYANEPAWKELGKEPRT